MLALLLRLGFWQLERAETKEGLLERFAGSEAVALQSLSRRWPSDDLETWQFHRVRATGEFVSGRQYLLDNQTHEGKAGYHVLTPFVTSGGTIMVDRGWIPVGGDRRVLPDLDLSEMQATVTGRLVAPPRPGLVLGSDGYEGDRWPRVVQLVDLKRMNEQLDADLSPALLELDPEHDACFVCVWRPVGGITPDRHRGYALQWFSLAVALVVLLGVLAWLEFRRERT